MTAPLPETSSPYRNFLDVQRINLNDATLQAVRARSTFFQEEANEGVLAALVGSLLDSLLEAIGSNEIEGPLEDAGLRLQICAQRDMPIAEVREVLLAMRRALLRVSTPALARPLVGALEGFDTAQHWVDKLLAQLDVIYETPKPQSYAASPINYGTDTAALPADHAAMALLLDRTERPLALLDDQWRVLYANTPLRQVATSGDVIAQQPIWDVLEIDGEAQEAARHGLAQQDDYSLPVRSRSQSGDTTEQVAHIRILRDEERRFLGLVMTLESPAQDVLQPLSIQTAPLPMALLTSNGIVVETSMPLDDMLQTPTESLPQIALDELFTPLAGTVAEVLTRAVQQGAWEGAARYRWADGSLAEAMLTIFPILPIEQEPRFALLVREMIDIERTAQERIAAQEQEIFNQTTLLQALDAPVVTIAPRTLLVPVIGTIDAHRARMLVDRLLDAAGAAQATTVLLDLTPQQAFHTELSALLARAASGLKLLGATTIVCGLQPIGEHEPIPESAIVRELQTYPSVNDALTALLAPDEAASGKVLRLRNGAHLRSAVADRSASRLRVGY